MKKEEAYIIYNIIWKTTYKKTRLGCGRFKFIHFVYSFYITVIKTTSMTHKP